jgi:hypothetical protein
MLVREAESEKNIVAAENNYIARLACATAYEAANVFRDFRNIVKRAGRLPEVEKLHGDGKEAFAMLDNMFKADQKDFEREVSERSGRARAGRRCWRG